MNIKEASIKPLASDSTDASIRVKERSRTAKIASGVAGGVLSLLPATIAMAEPQPLGTTALDSDEIAQIIFSAYPKLGKAVPKDRFDLFINGLDVSADIDDIYTKAFRIKSILGSKNVIIKALTKVTTVPGVPPANSYFPITNADGTLEHQVIDDGTIKVDGEIKYGGYECYYDQENIHPTKTGIKILLYNTGTTKGKNVLRVDNLDAENYCDAPVDTQESTVFQPEAIPEIEFELGGQTHKLRGIALYKEKLDQFAAQVNLDGIPYDRDAGDPNNIKWKPENPVKGNADFIQTEWLNAFTAVETQDGRKFIVGAIDAGNVKFIVFEPEIDKTTGAVILNEVTVEVKAVDPNAPPLDDDGDGTPNAEDSCIGYTNGGVDTNGNNTDDVCEAKCVKYANEGTLTPSDLLPCTSNLGYESAGQLKDGSTLHYTGSAPVLGADGKIIAQNSSKLRYIHSTLVGAVPAPELARDVALPDGYNAQIKVNSGVAHVTGFDFLGAPVEVTVTPESGLVDLGFVYGAEVGVEGSDYELTVGSEYQPCGVAVCGNQNPEPPAAEPTQTAETPAQAEATQTEPPVAQVELPTPQPEPVLVAEIPMPVAEPIAESSPELVAEPTPDVVESSPETDTGSIIVPPADVMVYVDTPAQGSDTPPVEPDVPSDTMQNPDTKQAEPDTQPAPDTASDTPSLEDTADAGGGQDLQAGTDATKTDKATGTDAPVQGKDTQTGTPQGKPDTNQPAQKDTENPQPKSEEKSEGGGGGCAIEKPNDHSFLNTLAVLGATALAWASRRRKRIREVLTSQH